MRATAYIAVFISLLATELNAQQEWMHTQHAFSLYDVNAAAVGDGMQHALSFRYRNQWTGVEGAPKSFHFSYQSPYGNKHLAWGVQLLNESIGAHQNTSIQAAVAYKLRTSEHSHLSFALEGGMINMAFDKAQLQVRQSEDPALLAFNNNTWSPLINAGAFWRNRNTYFGAEVSQITESDFGENTGYNQSTHVRFVAGHAMEISPNLMFKPMLLVRHAAQQSQFDLQAAFFVQHKLWVGAGYRHDFGWLALMEYQFSSRLRLGYSIDIPSAQLVYPGLSHELFLGVQWRGKANQSPSIRYFQ